LAEYRTGSGTQAAAANGWAAGEGKARGAEGGCQGRRDLSKKVSCVIIFSDYFL